MNPFLKLALLVSALLLVPLALGNAASWVLGYFGVIVPWHVCAVGLFLAHAVFNSRAYSDS